ncbi:MAG: type II/IV secretion system protein [Ignavibacteriales bacterium]|nr:MAG: type II/IV secretion system protein [Ignavibacteriales bacterium]
MALDLKIEDEAVSKITAQQAFEWNILPIKIENKILQIGTSSPNDKKLIDDITFFTGYKVKTLKLPSDIILEYLKKIYGSNPNTSRQNEQQIKNLQNESSNVELINKIIEEAIENFASDIHLESFENNYRVRFRVDGHLREVMNLPIQRSAQIGSRVKIMAGLDISEKRKPQDGKIKYKVKSNDVDIRVSTLPTNFGEKTVLRILDKSHLELDIEKLGLFSEQLNVIKKNLERPFGMILVTGPTGSGKTTSLYSFLQHIHRIDKNILTVEDPIEYNLYGINQCNVKPDIGFNFASALRSFLRQDPDIIMVGEIRDRETADIAVRAALTGHLVFSTLHTNDSTSAITRLIDMGVDSFLVAASVKLIIAQRLIRKLCNCKIKSTASGNGSQSEIFVKCGCTECGNTGYKGRSALFEVFEITDEISEMISVDSSISQIKNRALEKGFMSLRQAGLKKIQLGITTNEEVIRETTL